MSKILLIVDLQKEFIGEENKGLPAKIAAFLEKRKSNFDQILFFKFLNDKQSNWYQELRWDGMLEKSEAELVEEIKPFVNENNCFIKQAAFSVFRVKDFTNFLKQKEKVELYLAGLDTHACIYQSALEAFERGYKVRVIEDLCAASHGEEYHQWAIKSLQRNLGTQVVVSSKDFV